MLQVFEGVAERLLALQHRARGRARGRRPAVGQVLERDQVLVEPLAVGLLAWRSCCLSSSSAMMRPCSSVDEEHAARLQAALVQDVLGRDVEHADLGRHDDQVVLGDVVARGPQAVAVEHGADAHAVGEGDRRRAVPRLHQAGVVFVERLLLLAHASRRRATARGSSSSWRAAASGRSAPAARARCRTWPSRCRRSSMTGRIFLMSSPNRSDCEHRSRGRASS